MSDVRRAIYGALVTLAVLLFVVGAPMLADATHVGDGRVTPGYETRTSHDAIRCAEDDPCWNWRTIGNRLRGVVTVDGRRRVVGGQQFDALDRARRIDWKLTPRLRGDH